MATQGQKQEEIGTLTTFHEDENQGAGRGGVKGLVRGGHSKYMGRRLSRNSSIRGFRKTNQARILTGRTVKSS
jgi:hypothetical protein